jgi:hypothetical protein
MYKPSVFRLCSSLVLCLSVLICATGSVFSQSVDEENLPPGNGKDKAENSCLSCHEARIIVQQRLSKAAWTREVDKMTKWGAEVDPKDRDALIDYLSANFGPDQPPYQAPTSAQESRSKN